MSKIPLSTFIRCTNKKELLPFYHTVSDEAPIHLRHLYPVRSTRDFERDLDFFLKYFSPIDIDTFLGNKLDGKPLPQNTLLLTFDDGLREFHDVVAPILIRKGIPAVCFLNSRFVDNKELFFRYKISILIESLRAKTSQSGLPKEIEKWFSTHNLLVESTFGSLKSIQYAERNALDELALLLGIDFAEYLQKNKPYLENPQIKSLIKQGFSFGAHSLDHPRYADLSLDEQLRQTRQCLDELTTKFDLKHRLFAFPFTDHGVSNAFFDTIFDKNKPLFDLSFGTSGLKTDSCARNFQRIPIEIDQYSAQQIVYGEYIYYFLKAILNKNSVKRE